MKTARSMLNRWKAARDNAAAPDASGVVREKSQPEEEYELEPCKQTNHSRRFWLSDHALADESTFDDFDELVIQWGYVTLFVVAFPITPLLV